MLSGTRSHLAWQQRCLEFSSQVGSKKSSSVMIVGSGDIVGLGGGVLGSLLPILDDFANLNDFGHLHGHASLALADFANCLFLACVLLCLGFD